MNSRLPPDLESLYPNLKPDNYQVTSNKNKKYNCVAWAAERDEDFWWEPLKEPGCYWPSGVPFDHAFENYVKVFELAGYTQCKDSQLEEGFEKVALYKDIYGWFCHVSHQLEDGSWTSKLGPDEDLKHKTPESLEGDSPANGYGKVSIVMKRGRKIWENLPNPIIPNT